MNRPCNNSKTNTLGVLGNGQLGRMFCLAAQKLGHGTVCLGTSVDSPCADVSPEIVASDWVDKQALQKFAQRCVAATVELEQIPQDTLELVQDYLPLYPSADVIAICQDRLLEKNWLYKHGFPVVPFASVKSQEDLETAASLTGFPSVLKTTTGGYDGHGQAKVYSEEDLRHAWHTLKQRPCILEAWLSELTEISVITARNKDGQTRCFPVCENIHKNHILAMTTFPACIPSALAQKAQVYAMQISQALRVIGLLTVEFFVTQNGNLLINELAPRPHNSGHATIEACNFSQFDMQVLTMTNSPLPKIEIIAPVVMINLLGQLWLKGTPDFSSLQNNKNFFLHLYGKKIPKKGRKMGHLTALQPAADQKLSVLKKIACEQEPSLLKELT